MGEMKRKAIQLANNTLVVSLPSAWTRKTGIEKGAELNIEEAGSMLLISPPGTTASRNFTIDTDKMEFNKNILSYLYQKGYDEVEVINLDSAVFTQIKERVSDLLGFEIIEHSAKRCVVKTVSKEMDSEFDNMLRRAFRITLELAGNLLEAVRRREYSRMSELRDLEKTTNMFTDFCKRVISKGSYKDPENSMYIYIIVRDLEKIADSYKRICDVFLARKGKALNISKKTVDLLERSNAFFEMFYKLFYKFDSDLFADFQSAGRRILHDADTLLLDSSHEESMIITDIIFVTTMTYDLSGPFFILNFGKSV